MRQVAEYPKLVVAATSVAAILVVGLIFWKQRKQRNSQKLSIEKMTIPTKWTKIGEVGGLIMYPLKGAKRKCVTEAYFTKIGLREILAENTNRLSLQDRVFLVYNENNDFMNIKKNPKMLLINTSAMDETRVKFSFPEIEDLIIQVPEDNNNLNEVNFYYGEKVKAVDCGDEAAAWFSKILMEQPSGLRLGCFVQSLVPPRSLDGAFEKQIKVYPKLNSEYLGAFADIASYMLMSEESLNNLNSRLETPVTEHNFRPNILVKGSPAYSEDTWDWVRIGDDVVLRAFKYCTRCVVTTIDPDTGKRDPSIEPLRTLRMYRQVQEPELKEVEGSSPVMGMYLGCHRTGTVRIGDPVFIAEE